MTAGAVGSAALAGALVTPGVRAAVVLGMIAPLAAAVASWIVVDHTFRQNPLRLTSVMLGALAVKAVFFLLYVTLALRVIQVTPEPFAISFAAYFIGLYAVQAVFLRRLFSRAWRPARS
jgi:hypothetical protein